MVQNTTHKQIARNNITYAFCFEKIYQTYLQMSVNSVRVRLNGTLHRLHLKRSETILYSSIMIKTIPVNTLDYIIYYICHCCGMMYKDKYVHDVVVCEEMALQREDFYAHVWHTFGNQVYNELRSGSDERKLQTLIGKRILALLNLNIQKHFLRMAISYVSTCMLSV